MIFYDVSLYAKHFKTLTKSKINKSFISKKLLEVQL